MSPLGNEDARAQVGTNGGLSQQWREKSVRWSSAGPMARAQTVDTLCRCADELDAAKLRIEEAMKALENYNIGGAIALVDREAVLKIIREIL